MHRFTLQTSETKLKSSNSNEWLLAAMSQVEQTNEAATNIADASRDDATRADVTSAQQLRVTSFYIEHSSEDERSVDSGSEARNARTLSSVCKAQTPMQLKSRSSDSSPAHAHARATRTPAAAKRSLTDLRRPEITITANHGELFSTEQASPDVQPLQSGSISRNVSLFNLDMRERGDYILQAAKQIGLAQQCEANSNFRMAFNYYRNGVGILLTGVQRSFTCRPLIG